MMEKERVNFLKEVRNIYNAQKDLVELSVNTYNLSFNKEKKINLYVAKLMPIIKFLSNNKENLKFPEVLSILEILFEAGIIMIKD